MRATARMTSKGQVTIPLKIRKKYGMRTGDALTFVERNGTLQMEAVKPEVSVFEKWRGIGNPGLPSGRGALVQYFREARGHDPVD